MEKSLQKMGRALERFEKQFNLSSDAFYSQYESGSLQGDEYAKWANEVKAYRKLEKEVEVAREKVAHIGSARKLAFIQCVGSRDNRFNPHCSGFCCMHAIKEAIIACEHDREAEVFIFGMDIRAVGKGFEEYRNRGGTESGIKYIRSRVAEITEKKDHTPVIWYEDTMLREVKQLPVDLVILATACEQTESAKKMAEIVGVSTNEFGFFATSPSQPLDTTRPGVFVCGCAQSPMDIPESVAQASSAAARAAQVLSGSGTLRLAS
ncbi:MAG: CoB--CoM heterodisulfide reductase iron-sulfur subunit A family protein [Deltaproteobacteria bacterium]|nr:CoB--CoM heterodisulfide reductase iron-sulfur subunit A family protein [Deltaproteobacteria bacterium]